MPRKLKVYEMGDVFHGKAQPQIRLQGKWLRKAGFLPHDRILVREEGSRLVIERCDVRMPSSMPSPGVVRAEAQFCAKE